MSLYDVSKRFLMGACTALLCACSGNSSDGGASAGSASTGAGAAGDSHAGHVGEDEDEQCPEDYLAFSTGATTGLLETDDTSGLAVRLLEAPNPPIRPTPPTH